MVGTSGSHRHGSLLPRPAPSAAQPVQLPLTRLEIRDPALTFDTVRVGAVSQRGLRAGSSFFKDQARVRTLASHGITATARHTVPEPTRPTARLQLLMQENAVHGVYELIAFATCMVFPLNALPAAA